MTDYLCKNEYVDVDSQFAVPMSVEEMIDSIFAEDELLETLVREFIPLKQKVEHLITYIKQLEARIVKLEQKEQGI